MSGTTYSFLDVVASIVGPGGSISLGAGAASTEEGITVSLNDPTNNMAIAADGIPMHSLNASKGGTVTFRFQKTSPVNQKLMAMYNLQRASAANHGKNTISIVTVHGQDVVTCRASAFQRAPDINYQTNAGMNEWVFDCGIIDFALGSAY